MSHAALTWAWGVAGASRLPPSQRLVLLAYATVADGQGCGARLKRKTLMDLTGLSRSAIAAARAALERQRFLRRRAETSSGVAIYDLPVTPVSDQLALELWGEAAERLWKACGEPVENLRIQ